MSTPDEPEPSGPGVDGTASTQSAPPADPSSVPNLPLPLLPSSSSQAPPRSYSPTRTPTSAEIDAVIAAAIANAPPAPPPPEIDRSTTPLMTDLLPSAVGLDGRVNLFVGNLPYRVRWQDLKDLFRKAGTVLRADVSLGPDNRSRGYGTVLMGSREDAARAIDRFNGFTWQTRTLEVRPDRLPPEYEPQPHAPHHHAAARPPIFNYHAGPNPPYPHLGPPPHAGWAPGQLHRALPLGAQVMQHHFSLPGHAGGFGPGGHPLGPNGPISISHSASPGSSYGPGGMPLPILGQNTGSAHQPIGASLLAGSLTGGPAPTTALDPARRNSLSPFAHPVQTDIAPSQGLTQSSSPALPNSRPASSTGKSSPIKAEGSRPGPPGSLGSLPPPLFPGVKAVISPPDGAVAPDIRRGSTASTSKTNAPPVAIAMEGLSHQGQHMGPPDTLHDRVVFVSNLPLSMQWQELKDLLRPAGVIIRADVATDSEGRPRGFGTALFAAEKDAATAVNNYHGREILGHRIRVSLEREINESLSRRGSAAVSASAMLDASLAEGPAPAKDKAALAPLETPAKAQASASSSATSTSPASRVPWSLNTNSAAANSTPSRQRAYHEQETPQQSYRHQPPGPIQMPTFAPLDTPGHNPLSPLQRGLPPMTPSMPGFVFNAYPETPPVHPHFMSPGMGPFSPGIPVTSPTGFQYNPFLNAAPGAPVGRYPGPPGPPQGHQTHFSQGSAALGTPTTQAFPNNPIHGYRNGGNSGQMGDYFPSFGSVAAPGLNANGTGMGQNGYANGNTNGSGSGNTSEPSSPSTRLARPSPSPLNAKDRMASTSSSDLRDIGGIIQGTERIRLGPGIGPSSPTRPGKSGEQAYLDLPELSRVGSGSTVRGDDTGSLGSVGGPAAVNGAVNTSGPGGGPGAGLGFGNGAANRASIDGARPNLGVWDTGSAERRASFGDIVAGRARE